MTSEERTAKIRELNDLLRTTGKGGRVMAVGSLALGDMRMVAVAADRVRNFQDFTEENDPHGEHDFGAFEIDGVRLFWKIDYYALDEETGSSYPEDPNVTVRVLSIFYASDY